MVSRTMIFVAVATCVASIAATTCDGKDGACQIGTNQLLQMDQTNLMGENRALRGQDGDANDPITEACLDVDAMYKKCDDNGAFERCSKAAAILQIPYEHCLCEDVGCRMPEIGCDAPHWQTSTCQAPLVEKIEMNKDKSMDIEVVGRDWAMHDLMMKMGLSGVVETVKSLQPGPPPNQDPPTILGMIDMNKDGIMDIEVVGKEWAMHDLMKIAENMGLSDLMKMLESLRPPA